MHCKQLVSLSVASLMLAAVLTGCGGASSTASSAASSEAASAVSAAASEPAEAALPDGVYTAEFDTDSGMFHANEACNGMGTLTVENGQMTFHVSLASKKIVNLYVGMAADAEANKATGCCLPPTPSPTLMAPRRRSTAMISPWPLWTRTSSWHSSGPRASGMTTP